jgi:hypothetical protein
MPLIVANSRVFPVALTPTIIARSPIFCQLNDQLSPWLVIWNLRLLSRSISITYRSDGLGYHLLQKYYTRGVVSLIVPKIAVKLRFFESFCVQRSCPLAVFLPFVARVLREISLASKCSIFEPCRRGGGPRFLAGRIGARRGPRRPSRTFPASRQPRHACPAARPMARRTLACQPLTAAPIASPCVLPRSRAMALHCIFIQCFLQSRTNAAPPAPHSRPPRANL